ncbi:MAG TPA: hypothetical protein VGF28_18060 [Thermoanaerobaculia bacterium]
MSGPSLVRPSQPVSAIPRGLAAPEAAHLAALVALFVLVLNDHVLKYAAPSAVTGKLSDFAGVYLLAVVLRCAIGRWPACVVTAAAFIWWKSPMSQRFIDSLPWLTTRVVDWTDLSALAMLPLAAVTPRLYPASHLKRALVAAMSLAAFAATSPSRQFIPVPDSHELRNFPTGRTLSELQKREACGLLVHRDQDGALHAFMRWSRWRLIGSDIRVEAVGTADEVNGKVVLHFEEIRVVWERGADEEPYLVALRSRLKKCLADQ